MRFLILAGIMSLLSFHLQASTPFECFKLLPDKLQTDDNSPNSARFSSSKEVVDFESMPSGKGWGQAIKYQNNYCEIIIYTYTRNKSQITDDDVAAELSFFDGFSSTGKFKKEVGYDVFQGLSGTAKLSDETKEQTQIVAISKTGNYFVKYRTSCRFLEGFTEEENFKLADAFLTQAMKGSFGQLAFCLRGNKLSD